MRIETAQPASLGLLGRAPGLIPEWRIGAVIEATAVRGAAGELWLNIGQMRLAARLASGNPAGPADGEALRLKVLRNSPVLAFEVLQQEEAGGTDPAGEALRRMLPRQQSPAALLANLGWLAAGKDHGAALPRSVMESAARVWQNLPAAAALTTGSGLATALDRSGIFLESHLSAGDRGETARAATTTDMKALLLGFKASLPLSETRQDLMASREVPAPLPMLKGSLPPLATAAATLPATTAPAAMLDALGHQTDGALARLTATQLMNLAAAGLAWLIEVPVRQGDEARLLRFRFERDTPGTAEEAPDWTVEAAFEIGSSEAVHARVGWRRGRVSVQLRSDSPALVGRLKAQTNALTAALLAAGLDVDQVVCLHGLPVGDPGQARARLVDLQA